MKRIYFLFVILALAAMLLSLSSCGIIIRTERVKGDEAKASVPERATEPPVTSKKIERYTTPGTDPVKNPQTQLLTLPETDFRKVFYTQTEVYFMICSPDGGSAVSVPGSHMLASALKTAKNEIGKRYNVQLVDLSRTEEKLFEDLEKDTYFCDLLALPPETAIKVIKGGYAVPLHQIPFLDPGAVYVQNTDTGIEELDAYGFLTDASYLASDVYCLYFDLTRVDPAKIPYENVIDGKWDFQALAGYLNKTGLKLGCKTDLQAILRAFGAENTDLSPYLCAPEGTPDVVIDKIGNYENYLKNGNRFGMMPLPDCDLDYVDDNDLSFFVCPKKTITLESAGLVMSALGASACGREAPALREQIAPWVHDNGTTVMLDYLVGGKVVTDLSPYVPAEEIPEEPVKSEK